MDEMNAAAPESAIPTENKDLNQQKVDIAPIQQQQEVVEKESSEDPNWRAFREARKRDRAEKEAAERRAAEKEAEAAALKAALEAAFGKGNAPQQSYGQEYHEETEDERIEKKVQAALAKKLAEEERIRSEREAQEYPRRLQQAYPDFNSVITSENIDYLEYHYPEIARPFKRLADNFEKWSDVYHAIKKFVPNHTTAKKEAAKAESNFTKPKSMSTTTLTQGGSGGNPLYLTEERRAANWARMQRTMKGIG